MPFSDLQRRWFADNIQHLDSHAKVVTVDLKAGLVRYHASLRCDEALQRPANDEELVRALTLVILASNHYGYGLDSFYIEKYYKHGHPSSKQDEVDLVLFDPDDLPFALWEFKAPSDFKKNADDYIRYQLFGTAPLVGAPKFLVYATGVPPENWSRNYDSPPVG